MHIVYGLLWSLGLGLAVGAFLALVDWVDRRFCRQPKDSLPTHGL
jgi:hypothetical protein